MRRAPARPVRAGFVRTCCAVVVQEHDLHAGPGAIQRQANTFFTLHSARFTLRTSHFTLALCTPHFISSRIMWALLTSSHLISPLLISSHLFSHVIHLSKLFSTVLISSGHWSAFLISSKFISTHLGRSAGQKAQLSERSFLHKKKLGAESFCTQKLETQMHLHRKAFQNFVPQSLHKALPTTTLYYKDCTQYFSVLLCTTKLAQSTSQYYFVPLSLHKVLPILHCTTKLAQSTSQYHFVLQSLHKACPSTTLYYQACTKHFPVLLCATKLAQSTSQYYFVLQSLHKALPSATL